MSSHVKMLPENLTPRYPEQDLQRAKVLEACSRQYCARIADDGNAESNTREKGKVSLAGVAKRVLELCENERSQVSLYS